MTLNQKVPLTLVTAGANPQVPLPGPTISRIANRDLLESEICWQSLSCCGLRDDWGNCFFMHFVAPFWGQRLPFQSVLRLNG